MLKGYDICKGNLYEFTGENTMSAIAQDVVNVAANLAAKHSYHKKGKKDMAVLLQEAVIWNDMFSTPGLTACLGSELECLIAYINHRLNMEGMQTQKYEYKDDEIVYIGAEDGSDILDEGGDEILTE